MFIDFELDANTKVDLKQWGGDSAFQKLLRMSSTNQQWNAVSQYMKYFYKVQTKVSSHHKYNFLF